ncbi:hypothetical protein GALMADRAFT_90086 [Galerina marginata CBS 339.88]|uniref:rRNA-processing protein FYV7 n=1 Tax=Galerina marginata (strain CBS 339.88) TaxID=685588 RepID=A0A067TEW6_GALM3|nr:hypothetical protein GALMADRAFT_90086 [Galerina marginata CBS 339.88]
MSDSISAGTKRKKPPTFQHLPINRAKILKKAWVEKAKIKSKWKAQKRKEGLASNFKLELPDYSEAEDIRNEGHETDHSEGVGEETEGVPRPPSPESEPPRPHLHPSRAHIHPELPVKRTEKPNAKPEIRPKKKPRISQEESKEPAQQSSVRDLAREAYSRSTLHTYKSDPLKKRQSGSSRGGKGGNIARGQPQTGRGQPNMKLRMNAMLAKIKQDYAP